MTTAIPGIVIVDDGELTAETEEALLAIYIPSATSFKNNYVIPPEERVDAVDTAMPSATRTYRDMITDRDSIRLYLPGRMYSIGLTFDGRLANNAAFISWYGNLEAPFLRTPIGIDTRDFALDVVATADGVWRWKDEDEFARRLAVGIDSAAHQQRVWAAGHDVVRRLEGKAWPFNAGWQMWRPQEDSSVDWHPRVLPENWADDLGTHAQLMTTQ